MHGWILASLLAFRGVHIIRGIITDFDNPLFDLAYQ